MASNTDSTDTKGSMTGGLMEQLEARLQELEPERFGAFLDWISKGEWGPKDIHLVKLKGPKVKTSITMSEPLLQAAIMEAESQGFSLGVSSLLEFMVWDFLGRPTELVETGLRGRGILRKPPLTRPGTRVGQRRPMVINNKQNDPENEC